MKTIIIFSLIPIGVIAAIIGVVTLIQLAIKQTRQQSRTIRMELISFAYLLASCFLITGIVILYIAKDDASINLFKTIMAGGICIVLPGILIFYLRRF